jgi:hypothetical protein
MEETKPGIFDSFYLENKELRNYDSGMIFLIRDGDKSKYKTSPPIIHFHTLNLILF